MIIPAPPNLDPATDAMFTEFINDMDSDDQLQVMVRAFLRAYNGGEAHGNSMPEMLWRLLFFAYASGRRDEINAMKRKLAARRP